VLAAARQPNATRALVIGLICVLVIPVAMLQFGTKSPMNLLNPLRPAILYYYMTQGDTSVLPHIAWGGKVLSEQLAYALTALGGVLELVLVGALASINLTALRRAPLSAGSKATGRGKRQAVQPAGNQPGVGGES
jgi:hypothetical protein